MTFNLLVLSSDTSTGISFSRSLLCDHDLMRNVDIYGTASDPFFAQMAMAPNLLYLPKVKESDPLKAMRFVEEKIGKPIHLLYQPKSGTAMLTLSRQRAMLPVFLPSADLIETLEDKFKTADHLAKQGFPVPRTALLTKPEDVAASMKEIGGQEFWVRNTIGQGSKGALGSSDVDTIKDHVAKHRGWGHFSISERLPSIGDLSIEERLSDDFHPGELLNWVALYNRGELVAAQTRKRLSFLHTHEPHHNSGVMAIRRDDLHELSEKMLRSFGHELHGPFGADYMIDKDGQPRLTEFQAGRFYTTIYFLVASGLNFPSLYVRAYQNLPLNLPKIINPVPSGIVWFQHSGAGEILSNRVYSINFKHNGVLRFSPASVIHTHFPKEYKAPVFSKPPRYTK